MSNYVFENNGLKMTEISSPNAYAATIVQQNGTSIDSGYAAITTETVAVLPAPSKGLQLNTSGGGSGHLDYLDGQMTTPVLNPVDGLTILVTNSYLTWLDQQGDTQIGGHGSDQVYTNTLTTSFGSFLNAVGTGVEARIGGGLAVQGGAEAVAAEVSNAIGGFTNNDIANCVMGIGMMGAQMAMAAEAPTPGAIMAAAAATGYAAQQCGPIVAAGMKNLAGQAVDPNAGVCIAQSCGLGY
jgi:hypothetical protein